MVIVVRIWYNTYHYTPEDESREGLDLGAVLEERRQKRASSRGEQLDPTSVRAHYREFLILMARSRTELERLPHETPGEYGNRLHHLVETLSHQQQERFSDAILDELTRAYVLERYGASMRKITQLHTGKHTYARWSSAFGIMLESVILFRSRKQFRSVLKMPTYHLHTTERIFCCSHQG